jgi:hypothetical protein
LAVDCKLQADRKKKISAGTEEKLRNGVLRKVFTSLVPIPKVPENSGFFFFLSFLFLVVLI